METPSTSILFHLVAMKLLSALCNPHFPDPRRATSEFIWLPHIILDCYQRQATHITAGPRGLGQKRTASQGQNELKRKKEPNEKNKFKNQKANEYEVNRSVYTLQIII